MSKTKWDEQGRMGDYHVVLDAVEGAINKTISLDLFISTLRQIGMDDQEIMDVYAGEVLGV